MLGLDSWRNEMDVWLEKTHELVPGKTSEVMELGNLFEDPLIEWASEVLGKKVRRNVERRNGVFLVHLDASVEGDEETIEAKTTGNHEGWGDTDVDDPTDNVPVRVVIQCHTQQIGAGTRVTWVPVLMGGYRSLVRRLYRVERNEQLADTIVSYCTDWWEKHVVHGEKPDGSSDPPRRDVLNRIVRMPKSWAEVDTDLVIAKVECDAAHRATKTMKEKADGNLIAALGTCEGGRAEDHAKEVTFFEYPGGLNYGVKAQHLNQCESCGVGSYRSDPYRKLGLRKRTD